MCQGLSIMSICVGVWWVALKHGHPGSIGWHPNVCKEPKFRSPMAIQGPGGLFWEHKAAKVIYALKYLDSLPYHAQHPPNPLWGAGTQDHPGACEQTIVKRSEVTLG